MRWSADKQDKGVCRREPANSKKHRNGNAVRDFNECAIVGSFKNVAAYKGWFFVCRFFKSSNCYAVFKYL